MKRRDTSRRIPGFEVRFKFLYERLLKVVCSHKSVIKTGSESSLIQFKTPLKISLVM